MTAEEVRQRAVQRKLDAARKVEGMRYVVTEGPNGWYDMRHVATSAIMLTTESLHGAMEHASALTRAMTPWTDAQKRQHLIDCERLDTAARVARREAQDAMAERNDAEACK